MLNRVERPAGHDKLLVLAAFMRELDRDVHMNTWDTCVVGCANHARLFNNTLPRSFTELGRFFGITPGEAIALFNGHRNTVHSSDIAQDIEKLVEEKTLDLV